MTTAEEQSDTHPWEHWFKAAESEMITEALQTIFARLQDDVTKHQPVCHASGRCCHFNTHGHRLYVTGLEVAYLAVNLSEIQRGNLKHPEGRTALLELDGCPFQIEEKCSVHPLRPLGCRVYYCDPNAQAWQNPAYELYLSDLRTLHDMNAIEYEYIEWRYGLACAREYMQCE